MEAYRPDSQDKLNIKPQQDKLKISGDRIFATLQGEGVTAGEKAIFLRLHYCNLACGKKGGWKCDTGYTWDKDREEYWKESVDWSYLETASNVKKLWLEKFGKDTPNDKKRIVITGGEPLLQQNKIIELLKFLPNWKVEIETNGTIAPKKDLVTCQVNCSPKLSNSGNGLSVRYKPGVLKVINAMPNSWFKFVVSQKTDLDEVQIIIDECLLAQEKIIIMPEGQTVEETDGHLRTISDLAEQKGWKITKRNQLEWFGSKRRT